MGYSALCLLVMEIKEFFLDVEGKGSWDELYTGEGYSKS